MMMSDRWPCFVEAALFLACSRRLIFNSSRFNGCFCYSIGTIPRFNMLLSSHHASLALLNLYMWLAYQVDYSRMGLTGE
jgi:hypothetical protein